ncbi:hypothetical protein KFL_002620220 [Klebsormidium nitens]|uniref:SWIM-type domain-containing protein n=1 Tax=Klebsormidium nitens TaxID=105231 RepID=A0A1Y1IB77_KLENI|nr:hypothetical protein KFL_002620220 [Klebsormidium nitens]|eukprot:GAQ85956.1 hypothetical protein KFL_002620220 [Klebsormidium nitens]
MLCTVDAIHRDRAASQRDVELEAEELMTFYNNKCSTWENALLMEGWLQYWLQRGFRLIAYRDEECLDDPEEETGFESRADIAESAHASFLRGLGGKKMQLDIAAAVLVNGANMLLQMSDARARKEALAKPARGPTLSDNRRRNEEWRRSVEEMRETLRGGGSAQEGEREFARRVHEGGYETDPVGTDRIETRNKRRREAEGAGRRTEMEGRDSDEEEGTHRADTIRSERWRKKGRLSSPEGEEAVGGSGFHKDVLESMGDLTEEDLARQAEEFERLRERNKGRKRSCSRRESEFIDEEEEDLDEITRLHEELEREEEELRNKRRREEVERSEEEAHGEEEEEEEEEEEVVESDDERAREGRETARAKLRQQRVPDVYFQGAKAFSTQWGLARLKTYDAAICCGSKHSGYEYTSCCTPLVAKRGAGRLGNVTLEADGAPQRRVAYCGRLKKCASRTCWGLNYSIAAEEVLPNPDTHVFPLFEGTELTGGDRAKLKEARVLYDESLPKLKDPGAALPCKSLKLGPKTFRNAGIGPAEGNEEDRRGSWAGVRSKQQAEKEEKRQMLNRGDGLVKGRPVGNRTKATKQMKDNLVRGCVYKGTVVAEAMGVDAAGDPTRKFMIKATGLAGADTDKLYEVVLKRVCECDCAGYKRMMADNRKPFAWCKHIYAIMIKVLGFGRHDPLLLAVAFNKAEWMRITSKPATHSALAG